ncbi:MAG TPA: hypothetical protein VNW71_15735 [Thermoanaerobaculia bacterium]|nr:hypothetical protein [Thermoanaerobaculia bacterium]
MRIHPLQPIAVIVLVAVLWYMKKKNAPAAKAGPGGEPRAVSAQGAQGSQRAAKAARTPEEVYMSLREAALQKNPQELFLPDGLKTDEPYGAVMEMGIPNSVVTLACFADGDAGIYYKTGGGMKGGGSHETVRRAAKQFIALSQRALPRMVKTDTHPLPEAEKVRFYVLTQKGTFTTEANRQALGGSENELSALFYGGQDVVGQMRQVQEEKGG